MHKILLMLKVSDHWLLEMGYLLSTGNFNNYREGLPLIQASNTCWKEAQSMQV